MAYKGTDGVWRYANPHDLMFSTATMLATHWWKPDVGWVKIEI